MKNFLTKSTGILFVLLLMSSCTSIKQSRGYIPDQEKIDAIRIDVDDQESVAVLLGHPTMVATFDNLNWYYYSKKTERWAFFKEIVTEMDILAITFDDEDYVTNIRKLTVEDNNIVDPVSKKTVTHGKEVNFFAELFGNIGRFGAAAGQPVAGN
ncbi:MAG: outer membrane protein assembly factor BamE [Kordiimonadaceae bacterium]|jgi:outer membrane protein assembly factor BamE (lipoprotein component of BamABCDE complex)|nr:outer membrane protein assembly factor BamE [Kordiimonadaceae bacterium]MBT6033380.1 outer membrane protein assembly factor BamE [Kordiimonadaceae bacterium]